MLDPRLLRTFIAIIEAGGFTRAAERLHMTQSTLSQQLARLEETVGQTLVDRDARPIRPSAAGERLLGYARRIMALQSEATAALGNPAGTTPIHIGLPEDVFSRPMARLFGEFSKRHQEIRLDVSAGLSRDLTRRYRGGEFDIVVVKESAPSNDCRTSFPEATGWFESKDAPGAWPDPVPLVTFPPGGLYRETMFDRIERERRHWYIAFSGSSLNNVLVAVEGGLGITLLPVAATLGRHVRPYTQFGDEAPIMVSIYAWESTGLVAELVQQIGAALSERSGRLGKS
ncbi:LysR family transcriptional regulator [Microvirga aerilata]|uniref:LysR family transcriptional regulator n=1 Tax=Microvirga aerilata TaxID=670292 RepID=A0A936ZB43_9HYPH|nr:LysR family transcriptional regulator [Microvirga aerilata]MBL0406627.1 LysR family transcriptional regulator [Microvirga aerilata]